MYSIPECCCSPAFPFFSRSNWLIHNSSFIWEVFLLAPAIFISWFSVSLERLDESFESASSGTGCAIRFKSLKQCNIFLAPGSEQRQKPQNENRAGGSQTQILWPHSYSKSGAQQAPGPWLDEVGASTRGLGWTRNLDFSLRGRWVSPPSMAAGHGQGVCLLWEHRPSLVAWDISAGETEDNFWYQISPLRLLDQCPAAPLLSFDQLNRPSSLNLTLQVIFFRLVFILVSLESSPACQPPACFADARAGHSVLREGEYSDNKILFSLDFICLYIRRLGQFTDSCLLTVTCTTFWSWFSHVEPLQSPTSKHLLSLVLWLDCTCLPSDYQWLICIRDLYSFFSYHFSSLFHLKNLLIII